VPIDIQQRWQVLAAIVPNYLRDLVGELVGLGPRHGLGINATRILGAAGARKCPPAVVFLDDLIDLILRPGWMREAPLCVCCLKAVLVAHFDAYEPIRQVQIGQRPVAQIPPLVSKYHLDEQHITDGVAHSLVDKVGKG
jgi:hypothetical protein